MKHVLAFLCLLFLAPLAQAVDLKITCTPPVINTDGTPITAAQGPLTFSLYGGLQGQARTKLVTGATSCAFTRSAVAVGVQEYQVTATAMGLEGPMSPLASILVTPATPGPPTNTVVVTLLAYEMRGTAADGNLRMVSVGVVPEGTPCLPTSAIVGTVAYRQIERKSADLYSAPAKLPPVLWARCG
jgi:hypothetical protein